MKTRISFNDVVRRMAAMLCVMLMTILAPASKVWAEELSLDLRNGAVEISEEVFRLLTSQPYYYYYYYAASETYFPLDIDFDDDGDVEVWSVTNASTQETTYKVQKNYGQSDVGKIRLSLKNQAGTNYTSVVFTFSDDDGEIEYYPVWVYGYQLKSTNLVIDDGDALIPINASFAPETSTLTLAFNPNFDRSMGDESFPTEYMVCSRIDLTIEGTCHMQFERAENDFVINDFGIERGIACEGTLTFAGDFTFASVGNTIAANAIKLHSGRLAAGSYNGFALFTDGDIDIENGFEKLELRTTTQPYAMYWKANQKLTIDPSLSIRTPANATFLDAYYHTICESDHLTGARHVVIATDAAAAYPDKDLEARYPVWLGSLQLTPYYQTDFHSYEYDNTTRTLTLSENASISGTYVVEPLHDIRTLIYAESEDLTIKGKYHMSSAQADYAIYMYNGNLTLDGNFNFMGEYKGVYNLWDDIILDWTNTNTHLTATNFDAYGSVRVAEGKAFIDANDHVYAGILDGDERAAIANEQLTPIDIVLFHDNANNSSTIAGTDNKTRAVQLRGRTFYRDGDWNTLCLPFSMTASQIAASPLGSASIMEMDAAATNLDDSGTLTLNFKNAQAIEAGKPYIVKWTEPDLTISSVAEWDAFAASVSNGKTYEGRLVRLTADIGDDSNPVHTMAGGVFKGTFDGAGHIIKLKFYDEYKGTGEGTALFYHIDGATIQNTIVVGQICTDKLRPATFAAFVSGECTLKNCWGQPRIWSTSDNGCVTVGGMVAEVNSGATLNMTDCGFSGEVHMNPECFLGCSMIGYAHNRPTINLTNCLYAPAVVTFGRYWIYNYTNILISGHSDGTITNCYYNSVAKNSHLAHFADRDGLPGIDCSAMSISQLCAALGDNWNEKSGYIELVTNAPVNFTMKDQVFKGVSVTGAEPQTVSSSDGVVKFVGSYSPLASTAGRLLDAHNPNNGACRAALSIDESLFGGLTFNGWFTDAGYNNPATTIPFAEDGTVILYPKFANGTTSVTFAKEGYSTYYNGLADAVLPAGMKARIVTAKGDGQTLTYETIADGDQIAATTAIVPKATAVMLQTAASTSTQSIDISLASPSAAAITQTNLLHGSDVATTTDGGGTGAKYYKLTYGLDNTGNGGDDMTTTLGWYWGAADGAAFTSAAHKAWLALPAGSPARLRLPEFDEGVVTGIVDIEHGTLNMEHSAGAWYSLDGRRLSGKPSAKGLYIHNGKKVVIK